MEEDEEVLFECEVKWEEEYERVAMVDEANELAEYLLVSLTNNKPTQEEIRKAILDFKMRGEPECLTKPE